MEALGESLPLVGAAGGWALPINTQALYIGQRKTEHVAKVTQTLWQIHLAPETGGGAWGVGAMSHIFSSPLKDQEEEEEEAFSTEEEVKRADSGERLLIFLFVSLQEKLTHTHAHTQHSVCCSHGSPHICPDI